MAQANKLCLKTSSSKLKSPSNVKPQTTLCHSAGKGLKPINFWSSFAHLGSSGLRQLEDEAPARERKDERLQAIFLCQLAYFMRLSALLPGSANRHAPSCASPASALPLPPIGSICPCAQVCFCEMTFLRSFASCIFQLGYWPDSQTLMQYSSGSMWA